LDRDTLIYSLAQLPKRVSVKSLLYRIHLLSSIQAGLEEVAADRMASHTEVERRFEIKRRRSSRKNSKTSLRSTNPQK